MAETATASEPADRATAYLREVSPEMRGCAILSASGELLSSWPTDERWRGAARELIEAADRAGAEPASHAHVGTGDGEVFMVRHGELVAVAVTERLVLSSLVLFDLRAALRDLLANGA